jgi:hypothetical protein
VIGDLATELAASLTARDEQYRTLSTRIDDTDRCEMPIVPGVFCTLPGDHTGGCSAPNQCKCSHPRSLHGHGVGKCYATVCGCREMRVKA